MPGALHFGVRCKGLCELYNQECWRRLDGVPVLELTDLIPKARKTPKK
jgi:hypothetical protein